MSHNEKRYHSLFYNKILSLPPTLNIYATEHDAFIVNGWINMGFALFPKAFYNLPSSQKFITFFLLGTGLACLIKMEKPKTTVTEQHSVWTKNKGPFIILIHQESWKQVFSFSFFWFFWFLFFYSFILYEGPVWLALLKCTNTRPNK